MLKTHFHVSLRGLRFSIEPRAQRGGHLEVVDEGQAGAAGSGLQHPGPLVAGRRRLEVAHLQEGLGAPLVQVRLKQEQGAEPPAH